MMTVRSRIAAEPSLRFPRWLLLGSACAALVGVAAPSSAQPAPAADPPAPAAPAPTSPAEPSLGPGEAAADAPRPDRLREVLTPVPGGLTPAEVASLAEAHSPQVAVAEANRASADGQVVQTVVQYVPRVTLTAQYTRISEVDPIIIGGGGRTLVAGGGLLSEGPLGVGPCAPGSPDQCVVDASGNPVQAVATPSVEVPQNLNQYSLNANINVPLSDYFLRAVQSYQAASGAEEALQLSLEAQRFQVAADAKLALYQWIQAKGQAAVTEMSVEQARAQVGDAKIGLSAGSLSRADLMRVEAQLAQAEYTQAEAQAIEVTAARRLRTLTGLPDDRPLRVGVDVFAAPNPPAVESYDKLVAEASSKRLDLASARAQEEARDDAESVTDAAYLPRVDAFANLTYANPNQRVFLSGAEWNFTWDLGLRATWVVNDTFSTIGSSRAARAQTAAATAQRRAVEDGVRLEVAAAQADIAKAAPSLEAASRGLEAAEESYRVTKQLFAYGKATAVSLTDAEVQLTNARLRKLAAHVNMLSAVVRLEHATGRDRARH